MECDGLVTMIPYQDGLSAISRSRGSGPLRASAAFESFGVGLACQRITEEEVHWFRKHQSVGEAALDAEDMGACGTYNRDLHAAILLAAENSYLSQRNGTDQPPEPASNGENCPCGGAPVSRDQRAPGIARVVGETVQKLMERHILSALEDIAKLQISYATGLAAEKHEGTLRREERAPGSGWWRRWLR